SDRVSERTRVAQVTSPTTLTAGRVVAGGAARLTWRFEAAGSLVRPFASAAIYTVPLDPPAELVARLASALGVRSSLQRTTTGWRATSSTHELVVGEHGQWTWQGRT